MAMSKKSFTAAYKGFMYALHNAGSKKSKFTGKVEFDRFNPPYFDGRITLLLPTPIYGARLLRSVEHDSPSVPTVHALDKNRVRPLAASLLTLWIEREAPSKEGLLWHLAQQNEVIAVEDQNLSVFDAHKQRKDLMITHPKFRLESSELYTLNPLRAPCGSVINAFLSMLNNNRTIVMRTSFFVNLSQKSTGEMRFWNFCKDRLRRCHQFIVPLSSISQGHWGLAVIYRNRRRIEIFDSFLSLHLFLPMYASLVRFANLLHIIDCNSEGWSKNHVIQERSDICWEQEFGVDSAIIMMGYAYNTSTGEDTVGVHPKCVLKLRKEIRRSLIENKVFTLFTSIDDAEL